MTTGLIFACFFILSKLQLQVLPVSLSVNMPTWAGLQRMKGILGHLHHDAYTAPESLNTS